MKRYILPLGLCGLFALGIFFTFVAPSTLVHASSGSAGGARTFVVQGQATVPTEQGAYVSLTVTSRAGEGATAQADNLRAIERVKSALKKMGVPLGDATLGPYRLSPVAEGKGTAFEATQTLRVMLASSKNLGQVLDTALRSGATSASGGMAPPLHVPVKIRQEAVRSAISDAQDKARLLADSFGIQPGTAEQVAILTEGPRLGANGAYGWGATVQVRYAY